MRPRFLIAAAIVVWGAFVAFGMAWAETNIEDFFPWIPDNSQARDDYFEFIDRFGTDDTVILSWEGCRLGDPRVDQLRDAVLEHESRWVRDVVTAEGLIAELTAAPVNLTRDEAIDRLTHVVIGPDRQTTCLLIHLTQQGMRDRSGAVLRIIHQAETTIGLGEDDLRMGGQPYVGYYSSSVTRRSIFGLSIPVAMISTLLAWLSLRRRRLMVLTLVSSGCAALTALAVVPWAGYRVNGLLSALPSLVYVVTTSGVIHVTNYSLSLRRKEHLVGDTSSAGAHAAAVRRRALKPCLLSSVSTMLGTLSLVWSEFPAIREFGVFATIGVAIALAVQLGLTPALLARTFTSGEDTVGADPFAPLFSRLLRGVVRWRAAVITGMLLLTGVLIVPLTKLEGRFTLDRLFTAESDFVRNIRWLETHIGPIDTLEVVVGFDTNEQPGFFRRVRRMQQIEAGLNEVPGVVSTFSTVTLVPDLGEDPGVIALVMARSALERQRDALLGGSHLAAEGTREYWRVTLRTPLFDAVPREPLRQEVESRIQQVVRNWDHAPSVVFTGSSQVFHQTQGNVLRDFVESLLLAFVLILVMMVIALRSFVAGVLAMIPNVVPCLTVFGLLGWIDGGIDIGMTVAACIAVGIAVDDTAHLLMAYQRTFLKTANRERALRLSYLHSATPVLQTSLICGLSMLPYLTASLVYLNRFGLLLSVLMFAALLCDLLLLPALIATRLGRAFDPRASKSV